jgi:hypothetical protein
MKETKSCFILEETDGEEEKLSKKDYYTLHGYILHKSCILASAFKKDIKESRKNLDE